MAQQLLWSWTDDDSTFNLNRRDVGILEPGLYRGFDASLPGSMTLSLVHTVNGALHIEIDLSPVPNIGVVLSRQGVVVKEDAAILLVISPNNSANPRIDLIVMLHEYVEVSGGQPATYAVIQGTASATPVPPFLNDPARQVILGELYLPGNTTALNAEGVVYTKALPPMLGADATIMRTTLKQHSLATKQFSGVRFDAQGLDYSGGTKIASAEVLRNIYHLPYVAPTALEIVSLTLPSQPGHWFNIYFENNVILKTTGNLLLADSSGDVYIEAGEMVTVLNLSSLTPFFSPTNSYLVFRGGQANRSNDNKFYKMQSFTKGTPVAGPGAGSINLQASGNSFTLEVAADYDLNWIKKTTTNTSGIVTHNSGTVVLLQVFDTRVGSPPPIVLKAKHAAASPPTDYKPIWCPNLADYVLKSGDWLMLVEYDDYWRLVNVFGGGQNNLQWWIDNFSAQVESVVESKELQFTKLQSWDWASLPTENFDVLSKSVWITDEANGFHIEMPWAEEVWDIKILRSGVPVAVQKGTWVALKLNLNTGLPGADSFIRTGGSTNIFCVDKSVSVRTVKVVPGGVYIFIKTDTKWELVSYSQLQGVQLLAHDVTLADHAVLIAEKADIIQEDWHYVGTGGGEPAFQSDFSNALGLTARVRFMKDNFGFVRLTGRVSKASGYTFGNLIFTLPIGYRPDHQIGLIAGAWEGTGFMSSTAITIFTNGEVWWSGGATWPAANDVDFDTIPTFQAA
ncbi:hypothetical protein UFOVP1492_91 [uncultured Caudovirales phage]|uniref:Uncharacterized protein n=1 Tax=uncultured Caudovirales phage TaxID=2100421 RepID=A0A6J5RHX2_9CAUD|nr:hypothetical protein UFOVP1127_43 [uncultured Caudovirales phage]CAB4193151.1 hypothetical protein UFOVP1242_31 [uncultured Caudovirales phage]CAB4217794.1 hypothetical protein UFOVP1492_91 [uncultured Caudovirales phage]CAB5231617.1 hypothetical protein UFOVP1580_120 [uncultured Caudovirales phage]